jgi:hypothetical protein
MIDTMLSDLLPEKMSDEAAHRLVNFMQASRYFRDAPLEHPSSVARENDATNNLSRDRPAGCLSLKRVTSRQPTTT